MEQTTCIRKADWAVVWDARSRSHKYLRNVDIAFTGNTIDHVGKNFKGKAQTEIDGRHLCVQPGFVNVHCHPTSQPITRGVREELGNPSMYMSALYDRTGLWEADQDGMIYGMQVAFCELIKSGVTSVIDFATRVPEGWLDVLVQSGLRVFAGPGFRDAQWRVVNGSRLEYEWDERAGERAFEQAVSLVEAAIGHPCGRLSGVIAPSQVDTCTERTFQKALRLAEDKHLMMQTHASQSVVEFQEMTRRTGKTPVQWLDSIGVLGRRTTVAHGIFIDAHSMTCWPTREDVRLLAESGTTVAHCPLVFSRYGQALESVGGYLRAGVNIGIGTDTAPHNMLEEIRQGLILARVASRNIYDLTAGDLFHAATVGGARAYLRDDIGRLAKGAKADLVLVDLRHSLMRPMRDPLRNLIYTAAERAVRDVYVDGRQVLADGRVLTLDIEKATDRLEASQFRAEKNVSTLDPQHRRSTDISPLVLTAE